MVDRVDCVRLHVIASAGRRVYVSGAQFHIYEKEEEPPAQRIVTPQRRADRDGVS
jgi:hypothetical protein